jgi:hypothetical protein
MPIVPILHNQSDLAAAGRNDCHLRSSSRADLVHRLRLPIRQTKQQSAGGKSRIFIPGPGLTVKAPHAS